MSALAPLQNASYRVFNGLAPIKEPRAMKITLDFSVANPYYFDFEIAQASDAIEFVQSAFVDNSTNPNSLTLTCLTTNHSVIVPAGYQGFVQLFCPNTPRFSASTTGSPSVVIEFLTFPLPVALWAASQGSTGLDHSANKPALAANLLASAAVNSLRASIQVQNQSGEQIQVVLDDGSNNNVSILLLAPNSSGAGYQGGDWTSTSFKGRVRVYGATSTDQVMVHED